jgi:putative endonuclease
MPNNEHGTLGEQYAADFLVRNGYTILSRNYHTRYGEIDLVAAKDDILAFVEVKTRRASSWGSAAGAVTRQKQHKLILAAQQYQLDFPDDRVPRFDVVAITTAPSDGFRVISCDHLEGAFTLDASNGFF